MISLDTAEDEQWPQIGRGGHLRNAQGQALVKIGNRNRIANGGSDLDPFEEPYTGDPIHGERGTHLHLITDLADTEQSLDDYPQVIADGVALGISEAKQRHAYDNWNDFAAHHGMHVFVDHIEQIVANAELLIASNIDRLILFAEGAEAFVGDTKTARHVDRRSYLLQATLYTHPGTLPYNPETGAFGEWPAPINRKRAYLFHLSSGELVEADDDTPDAWPTWKLIPLDLSVGWEQWNAICAARDFDYSVAFGDDFTQIAAPLTPPAGGEQPATDPERTATAPGSVATLDEARARYRALSDGDKASVAAYWERNGTDMTDATQIMESIDAVENFDDVHTEPVARPEPPPVVVQKPLEFSEGLTLDDATIDAAGRRYLALDDDVRSWVSVSGALVRLKPPGGKPTERRMELLRGLCALAEAGFDADDMARAVLAHVIGDEAWQGAPVADLVGTLDLPEARRFAHLCDAVAGAEGVALHYQLDGRAVITPSVAA